MTEKFIIGLLVLIYATGCLASIVEIHEQDQNGTAPSSKELALRYPVINLMAKAIMVVGWPLVVTWLSVRRGWR